MITCEDVSASYKTICYYVEKRLLVPAHENDAGYRMFGHGTIEILQRILMLKYLNLFDYRYEEGFF